MEREFEIYQDPSGNAVAVKRGFNWPAFLLSWIWALSRRLWVHALLLFAIEGGLGWLVQSVLRADPVAATVFGLAFGTIVGSKANRWRTQMLESTGHVHIGIITATSAVDAVTRFNRAGKMITPEMSASRSAVFLKLPRPLQRIAAVAALTLKAAFRYRLVLIMIALLMTVLIGLPLVVKDDGSARGLTQIVLTYTLSAITVLLGFVTLWLACGTLARDVEECQMQVVASKPIYRWEVWVGKWMGIMVLNTLLLVAGGLAVYTLIYVRAKGLSQEQQEVLLSELLVGRNSVRPPAPDLEPGVESLLQERLKDERVKAMPREFVRKQLREELKRAIQIVMPGTPKQWRIPVGHSGAELHGKPLYVRLKFQTSQRTVQKTFSSVLAIASSDRTHVRVARLSLSDNTFHEIPVPPDTVGADGILVVEYLNENDMAMLFPIEDGIEVLYYECGFGLNFSRALAILFLWLGLLAALGLAAASYLSFPVAAFLSLSVLIVAMSSGTIASVVNQNGLVGPDHEGNLPPPTTQDVLLVPVFKVLLNVLNLAEDFSPIDALGSGRSISWGQLARAAGQIGGILTGSLALIGIFLFNRRELATTQGTQ